MSKSKKETGKGPESIWDGKVSYGPEDSSRVFAKDRLAQRINKIMDEADKPKPPEGSKEAKQEASLLRHLQNQVARNLNKEA